MTADSMQLDWSAFRQTYMSPTDARRCGGGRRSFRDCCLLALGAFLSGDAEGSSLDLAPPPPVGASLIAAWRLLHDGQGQQEVQQVLTVCPMGFLLLQ